MDGLAGPLNETQMEYLRIAQDSCNQLRACINDLLDATRVETGKLALDVKPVALGQIIKRVVATINPKAAKRKIELRPIIEDNLQEATVDQHRITQVITNLLNNALKYTPECGAITINAGQAPDRPDLVMVSVSDTCCGISKEDQQPGQERRRHHRTGHRSGPLFVPRNRAIARRQYLGAKRARQRQHIFLCPAPEPPVAALRLARH